MYNFFRRITALKQRHSEKDKRLITAIQTIVGSKPFNLALYQLVTQHTSVAKESAKGVKESNERLEYLGDAILGAVVAEYLFKKFPYKDEGFLTEIRSRIVNRESLNGLARKIGLDKLIEVDINRKNVLSHKSIHGDTLEALVGAVYLDRGFKFCKRFILRKLVGPHYNINELIKTTTNYKSKIIEWAQKESHELQFEILEVKNKKHFKEFTAQVLLDGSPISKGTGLSKKKAEQAAAQKSCDKLKII
ncbi:ribonuclease III [Xanthovirga aplysinae]|uniref:ribonuclease III n=1 Tax=Xanthovirga aplysinae TaxID=2529853 RepID=UPI0016569714|nr:ribonuclease III [Xanthovirga aplysinae]